MYSQIISLHILLLAISCGLFCSPFTFFNILRTIATNKFLHLLHSSLITNIIIGFSSFFIYNTLGELQDSETVAYNEKVYDVCGDFFMLISIFSNELSIKSIIKFGMLYSFKSFCWVFTIKSQKDANLKMLAGSAIVVLLASLIAFNYYVQSIYSLISILLYLEYSLVILSLIRSQLIIVVDMKGIEKNRTLFLLLISISYLLLKCATFLSFIIKLSARHRFPYNILKALISTGIKLYKKLILFKKYLKLMSGLNSIKEVPVDGNCAICTEDIVTGKKLKCSHVFHSQCLSMWCEKEISCPICRAELVFEKEEKIETDREIIFGVPVVLEDYQQ